MLCFFFYLSFTIIKSFKYSLENIDTEFIFSYVTIHLCLEKNNLCFFLSFFLIILIIEIKYQFFIYSNIKMNQITARFNIISLFFFLFKSCIYLIYIYFFFIKVRKKNMKNLLISNYGLRCNQSGYFSIINGLFKYK